MSGPGLKVRKPGDVPDWERYGTDTNEARSRGLAPMTGRQFLDTASHAAPGPKRDELLLEGLGAIASRMKDGPAKSAALAAVASHIGSRAPINLSGASAGRGLPSIAQESAAPAPAPAPAQQQPSPVSIKDMAAQISEARAGALDPTRSNGPQVPSDRFAGFADDPQTAPGMAGGLPRQPLAQPNPNAPTPTPGASAAVMADSIRGFNLSTEANGGRPSVGDIGSPGWALDGGGEGGASTIGQKAGEVLRGMAPDRPLVDAEAGTPNLTSLKARSAVAAKPNEQIRFGRTTEVGAAMDQVGARERELKDFGEASDKALEQSKINFATQQADHDALMAQKDAHDQFVQKNTEMLSSQMADLMSRKVDPTHLWQNGGQAATVGAVLADAMNAGVSWLYNKSPGEMGSHLDKLDALIAADTNRQQEEINSGRANLNMGAQMLAQMQNVYGSQDAARSAMMLHKWQSAKDMLTARLQRVHDVGQRAAIESMLNETTSRMGQIVERFGQESNAAAARAQAAANEDFWKRANYTLAARKVGVEEYDANTRRIGELGKLENQGEDAKDLAAKSVALPDDGSGTVRRLELPSAEEAAKFTAKKDALDSLKSITQKAIAIKRELASGKASLARVGQLHDEQKQLMSDAMQLKNAGSGMGAMDAQVIPLLHDALSYLEPSTLQAYGPQVPPLAPVIGVAGVPLKAAAQYSAEQDIARGERSVGAIDQLLKRMYGNRQGAILQYDERGRLHRTGEISKPSPGGQGDPEGFIPNQTYGEHELRVNADDDPAEFAKRVRAGK